jgi:hypothetical protein
MTIIRIDNPQKFVGQSLGSVVGQIADSGYDCLVTKIDKITKELVKDYDPLRLLIQVEKDIVTDAKIG